MSASRASIPNAPGLAATEPMTHVEALNLERLPEHLVDLSAAEAMSVWNLPRRRMPLRQPRDDRPKQPRQLLERPEDPDVAAAALELMQAEGIEVLLQAAIVNVTGRSGDRVTLVVRSGSVEHKLEGLRHFSRRRRPHAEHRTAERGPGRRRVGYLRFHSRQRPAGKQLPPTFGR